MNRSLLIIIAQALVLAGVLYPQIIFADQHPKTPAPTTHQPSRRGMVDIRDTPQYKDGSNQLKQAIEAVRGGRYDEAEKKTAVAAAKMGADAWSAWERLGEEFTNKGQVDRASKAFKKAEGLTDNTDIRKQIEQTRQLILKKNK
jgi:hypothetical protein